MQSTISQEQKYQKPSVGATVCAIAVGVAVGELDSIPKSILSSKIADEMTKLNGSLSADEFKNVDKAFKEAVKTSGLGEKGFKVFKITNENIESASKKFTNEIDNVLKFLPQKAREYFARINCEKVLKSNTPFYAFNKILISDKTVVSLANFHEMGHAVFNAGKVGRLLQYSHHIAMLGGLLVIATALCKTKKAPNEEPEGAFDKVTTFMKENVGKLVFLAFAPELLSEGMATIKGNAFAKKLLSPDLAKKVFKLNGLGFASYLLAAILTSLGTYLGVKVRDEIAGPKLIEN